MLLRVRAFWHGRRAAPRALDVAQVAARREVPTLRRMADPLEALRASLREQRRRLPRLLRAARRAPGEGQVHRLRVMTRRLRAVLRVAWPHTRGAPARRAARALRRLGRALGRRRKWDVALGEAPGLAHRPQRLGRGHARASRALADALERLDRRALAHDLAAASRRLLDATPAMLVRRAARLCRRLDRYARRMPRRASARHALRLELKKARYLLEACGIEAGGVRRLQGMLGREHDLLVLEELAGRSRRARACAARARVLTDAAAGRCLRQTAAALRRLQRAAGRAR